MNFKKIISLLMCILMICTVVPFYSSAVDIEFSEPQTEEFEGEFAEGQVIFLYTQTVSSKDGFCGGENVSAELAQCGITFLKELPVGAIYDTEIKENADGTFTKSMFFIGSTDIDEKECLSAVKALSSVKDASLNYYMTEDSFTMPAEITNPASVYEQYTKWWLEDSVHVPQAWQEHETMGAGVVVAVIDSGVYVNNPEIADNIWEDADGHRGFNAETLTYDATPVTNHGGNVAGIIAASANKSRFLIGVAPEAKIMAINVCQSQKQILPASVVTGINYAIENGADIITMSLSTTSNIPSVKTACEAAYNAGITVFSSAGNSKKSTTEVKSYPAAYPTVIGVMAYGKDEKLCDFSNYDPTGNYYNVAAPGYQILGLPMNEDATLNTASCISGTSQATPIVAGLAALYFSLYPDHTPDEFRNALLNSCTDTVPENPAVTNAGYRYKKVDAVKLLNYYDLEAPVVERFAGTSTVIDNEKGFIYGLDEGYGSIDDYVSVSNGDCEFIPTENGNGTGSILRVYYMSGELYKDYEIVIFGDADGDAICDGMDCAFCGYLIESGESISPAVDFACDVDFDDVISQDDYDIIFGCGLKMDFVSQIR